MSLLSSLFGSSNSSSSTSSTSNATNTAYETDRRAVASDAAVSVTGDNNSIDRSSSSVTQFFDTSNRSSTSTTSFVDNSNRSTTNINNTSVTDYGSVNSALNVGGQLGTKALDVAGNTLASTIDVLKLEAKNSADTVARSFDFAKASGANALQSSAQVLGFASNAIQQEADAFTAATTSGQSKMVNTAILAAAAVGIAFALR